MFLNLKESYKILDVFFSRISLLLKPHTSQPDNRMCLIILSNRSSRHFIDSLYILPIIETKEFDRIGYNGFLFPHELSASPDYSCGKRNPLYPIRSASFVSIVLYPILSKRMAIALIIFSSVRKKKLQYILGFFICKKKSYPVHFRRLYYCKLQTVFMTTIYDFVKHGFI